ncbi:bis(5'-adenosyl)-triphosphatase enpp4-like [Penaeus japonicus]|uniref:bis(5'-adenosyl)-triphosphatase enpp4-like n=1 Tax=Penaeus japonicus TaxID=27405 RepID=UPI001C712D21|nr:bis(5'-adenosyl)-triphosphatase enpp4-like [Penaeus japonicus]XP_042859464.1 bis(5'-adenosyl)-triphosphatase enpp4-like [Penaeus japonicus]
MTDMKSSANLVSLYVQDPDTDGHAYGPNSSYVVEELRKIDNDISYLYKMLTVFNLLDTTDVTVQSDHGMMAVPEESIINLGQIVEPKLYHTSGGSVFMHI